MALTASVPTLGVVVQVAVSGAVVVSLSATAPHPATVVPPILNATVPVGTPVPGNGTLTVSVKVTAVPAVSAPVIDDISVLAVVTPGEVCEPSVIVRMFRYSAGSVVPTV
jgi:hypothetical protein